MEGPPQNLQELNDVLLTSWHQMPEGIFRGLVQSMP